jgi:hypothetical protein
MWKHPTTAVGFLLFALAFGFYNQAVAKEVQTQEQR